MLGDLPRYKIVAAAQRVTGKYIFLKLTIFVQSLKKSGLGLNL